MKVMWRRGWASA